MRKNFLTSLTITLCGLSGCAVGPLTSSETARTVGKNNHELSASYSSIATFTFKYSYGLLEDLDLGLQYETLSFGARLKYAFINNPIEGWALATALGYGASINDQRSTLCLR